jgi:hypothetical protein
VNSGIASWHQGKLVIEHAVSVSHDSLHVIAGVVMLLAIAILLRRPLSSWRPWLWALVFALWNELVDLCIDRWPDPGQQYGEGAKDLLLTMFLPTLLMLVARWRPVLFAGTMRK